MRERLLNYIRCPVCKSEFDLKIIKENDIEIEEGILTCRNCKFSTAITDGIVNLLFNLDSETLSEANLHIKDREEMFEKELVNFHLEELEKKWAYMEQESSKDYGKQIKKIFKKTIEKANINRKDVILDLGAGTGWSTSQLAKISEYCIAIDLCKPIKLELSKIFIKDEGIFFERCLANMIQLPFDDNCFDAVTSVASLHHVTRLDDAMREIYRVLKESGKLILIGEPVVPGDYLGKDKEFISQKKKGFNEHQYTAYDWFKACEISGLYASDGSNSKDNLDKYYEINKDGIQNPLPIFVKKKIALNKDLKIAFLSQDFSRNCNGGVCRYTYDLAHALAESGNDVHVITKSRRNREYEYKDGKVSVHEIVPEPVDFLQLSNNMEVSKKNLAYSYSACLKLLNLIDKFGIQIVEVPLWDAEGFIFSLVKPVPLVIRLETPLFKVVDIQKWPITKDIRFSNWMEGETVRRADKAIAISKDIGILISNHHMIPQESVDMCPLGIEFPPENLLQNDGTKSTLNVLFVGRLEKRKGIETLFRAMPIVLGKVPNAQFSIVGADTNLAPNEKSYKKYLLEKIDKEFHENIRFFGYVDDLKLKNYYKTCDLFVAPSLYESFGLIFLEAMAWGKPVIGCDIGGIPEIVEDGKDGILIQPDNEKELANAMIKLLIDKELRLKMGINGRKKVENSFSINRMAEKTYNIYKKIISNYGLKDKISDGSMKIKNSKIQIGPNSGQTIDGNLPRYLNQNAPDLYKKLVEKQAGISFDAAWDRYFWALQLFNSFDKYINIENKTILDVGCGTGNGALALIKKGAGKVVGVDIKLDEFGYNYFNDIAEIQNISRDKIKLIEGDICDEKIFEPETFDIIMAVDSFEHIMNPEAALRNCRKFLKPGGFILIDIGPLYYSPIGHHLWIYFPKESDPWAHLRYEDITKVKDIDNWGLRHFNHLNKLTVKKMQSIIRSLNLEIKLENIRRCGEDMYGKYARDIDMKKVPNKEDLFIESVTYLLKKEG